MANPEITFAFGGISSESYFLVQNIKRPIFPNIDSRLIYVPGRNSPYDFGSEFTELNFVIDVVFVGTDLMNFREVVHELAEWLNPLDGAKTLAFSDEPHLTYRAKLTGDTDIEQILIAGKGSLTFECVDYFAEGLAQTQAIAGMPRELKDIDTTDEFQATISNTNVVINNDAVVLAREGLDYSTGVTNFTTGGIHTNTQADENQDLILDSVLIPHTEGYQVDYIGGSFDGSIHDSFENKLIMNNLPNFASNVLDYMNAVDTVNDWELYTDSADSGSTTFIQNTGYYTMNALNMDGAIRRINSDFSFPVTVDFLYRLSASDTGQSNPIRVEARVAYDGIMFIALLSDTGGQWRMGRIVAHNATQADFYLDGVRQEGLAPYATSLSDRVQFFTDQAWQAVLDIAYFGMVSEARTSYQQASYPHPVIATYTSDPISLDTTSHLYTSSMINYSPQTGAIFNGFDSSVVVQVDIFKNEEWQGYQVVNDGDPLPYLNNGDNLTGVQARFRVILSAYGVDENTATPNITPINVSVDGQIFSYQASGSFETDADAGIQQVVKASQTSITWEDFTPSGTMVTCSVSLNGGDYQVVNKGDPIPAITPTTDLSMANLKLKFDLTTSNIEVTPSVLSYSYSFTSAFVDEGERIGAEYLDLSLLESIGESYIGWDTTPNATQDVEVHVEITDEPNPTGAWVRVNNAEPIAGVISGDATLLNKKIFARQVLKSPNKIASPILHRLLFWVEEQGGGQIIYNGTADSYPIITINFLVDIDFASQPFSIIHVQTGNQLLFNGDFQAGVDVLEIDCVRGSVKLNGVYAMNRLSVQSDFLYFIKGANDFVITPERAASVDFSWKERFL